MKHVAFLFALVCVVSACAPAPVPTQTLVTPTATSSRVTPPPTSAPTPTATTIATETFAPTATVVATKALVVLVPTPVVYDHNPNALVIEADLPPDLTIAPRDMHVPLWRLYGDGTVVFAGERAPYSTGLDAVPHVGHLSEVEVQNLLAYLRDVGFDDLKPFYQLLLATDAAAARITVFSTKAKSVQVLPPDAPGAPQAFTDAFNRIIQTIPSDASSFVPTDGYLLATPAGSTSELNAAANEWANVNVRLADATDGISVSGNVYSSIAALVARNLPSILYREGSRFYSVRFAPNLPRTPHLTRWIDAILNAPREFDGRTFDLVGYYRGANVLGEASGSPPVTRSDWVIADDGGAIYVTGAAPQGLDPSSRADAWSVVHVTAKVTYVRLGTSYLEARRVEILSRSAPPPTPTIALTPSATITATRTVSPTMISTPTSIPIADADSAIAAIKVRYPEVSKIQKTSPGMIGGSTNITTLVRADGWDLVFWEGSGDCPAGCINNHYYYFSAKKDGGVTKVGEYVRLFNSDQNAFDATGVPMWGVPK